MYCTQAQVESYLGRDLTDDEAALFPTLEGGIADYIDTYCARTFEASRNVATSQLYDGGVREIFFDAPAQTISKIETVDADGVSAQLVDPSFYSFFPYNSTPMLSVNARYGYFPWGQGNIKVTGTFGDYTEPPQGIQLAATTMAANYLINADNDDLKSETIEGYARVFGREPNPIVTKLMDSYKRVVL